MARPKDETYIIDLCDTVLGCQAVRQHRFDFLRGDPGRSGLCVRLPVDSYYEQHNLVVEYHERQHSEAVKLFDNRPTVSGMTRGEQRRLYDARRQDELPKRGLVLLVLDYSQFDHRSNKTLIRTDDDRSVVEKALDKALGNFGKMPA